MTEAGGGSGPSREGLQLLASLPRGALLVDENGTIVFASERADDLLGEGESAAGRALSDVLPGLPGAFRGECAPGHRVTEVMVSTRRRPRRLRVECGTALPDGSRVVLVNEAAGRDRAAPRVPVVSPAEGDCDAVAELRRACHDLRDPLASAVLYVELVRQRLDDPWLRQPLEQARRCLDHLGELAGSLLDRSPAPRTADAGEALEEALVHVAAAVEEGGAVVERSRLPAVEVTHRELVRLFQNLVGNAVRHGGASPRVRVEAETGERFVEFTVRDDGAGLDPAALERAEPADAGRHGLGLLACRDFVERQGGALWVERPAEGGTVVHFTVPAASSRDAPT